MKQAPSIQMREAMLVGRVMLRGDIAALRFRFEDDVIWRPGQFMWLGGARLDPRPYSIASGGGDAREIEIHVKVASDKNGMSHFLCHDLSLGGVALARGPVGRFALPAKTDEARPLLMIAGGMGITPLLSMIDHAQGDQAIMLYWGAEQADALYLADHFATLQARGASRFQFVPVTGMAVGAAVARDFDDLRAWRIYLGGPPAMIDFTMPLLLARGAVREYIHFDEGVE